MNLDERTSLLTERGTLQALLADIPEEDVLDRGSFQSRLEDVERRLDALSMDHREPARARLTFRGRPVVGGHGVLADFGMKATSDFVKAITVMAASLAGPLGQSGPPPNRAQNQLLITSTVVGSFGFELEEYQESHSEQLPLGLEVETAVSQALTQSQALFRNTLGTDDELADAIAGVDPRARGAVRTFLETLVTNEASFALEVGQSTVRFEDVGQVRRSLNRLGQDNVHEDQQIFMGSFQGALPKLRTFEFRLSDDEIVVTGKLGPGIVDPDVINQNLFVPTQVTLATIRVGQGRPRYVLNQLPEWHGADAADD